MATSLSGVLDVLGEIAPLAWAEDWDNVGLLIEPPGRTRVQRVLLAIDLTMSVALEAKRAKADLVVAYHPTVFGTLKHLRLDVPIQRVVMECVQSKIAVYSPHTALDAAPGGVNDWLADGLGAGTRVPLQRGPWHADASDDVGQGRDVELARPVTFATLRRRIKEHLGLSHVRAAVAERHRGGAKIERVMLCAGAGGSVFAGRDADVYLTGEMRHHDVLAAVERGTSVILCEHTNTERGYLPVLAKELRRRLGRGCSVVVSRSDAEPLSVR